MQEHTDLAMLEKSQRPHYQDMFKDGGIPSPGYGTHFDSVGAKIFVGFLVAVVLVLVVGFVAFR